MYGRIPYLNNSLSSWATHCSNLRRLLYYTAVWLGASPSVPLTTTWYYQWGRRIWSRRNQGTSQKRKRHSISSALERIWKWTRPMDDRNKSGTCKRGNSRLLDTAFKTKPIKERTKGYFFNISNTYQHLRNTFKHVLFHKCCYQYLYHCCLPYLEPGNL